ncbi:MAG TPA: tetratricopeptide repeat protein [Steroidobacteraceae bacterium]|nr:tetratricopeptide repeat protein [Steroidobacteraceae bacterium]
MRKLLAAATLVASVAFAVASPAFADADPTVDQIYAAAQGGHLDQAQQMMNQVLADHPGSGRAHYVQAELYAREGKTALARTELATAEQLKPGLPFASPRSVQELKSQLGLRDGALSPTLIRSAPTPARFPWGTVLILAIAVGLLLMLFRRRTTYAQYPAAGPGMGGAPGAYGPGGYGPAPMGGGGIGSGIAGGLASGLAVGAGVVAGEELAHHFLDGGHSGGGVIPPAEAGDAGFSNSDMGGSDFGVNDPGSGWDDGGSGGGGGDWS